MAHIKTKHSEFAVESLINASRAMREGNHEEAEKHFEAADAAIGRHVEYLNSIGETAEANHSKNMYEGQKRVMRSAHKLKIKDAKKSEASVNQVGKGIFLKSEFSKPKSTPSGNPRYSYKGLHELHPEDRQKVLGMSGSPSIYPGADHHKFVYPTDSSGRLVHSQRISAPAGHDFEAAKASMQESSGGIKYSEGQGVRVHDPAHELHGKLGLVQLPNPSYPNKVQVMFAGGRREFLDQSKIQPSGSKMAKALATVINIKSYLGKKKI